MQRSICRSLLQPRVVACSVRLAVGADRSSITAARYLSTAVMKQSSFAMVDHSKAYEKSMQGLHGKQLALSALEGVGKDDADFDPFLEDEMNERNESEDQADEESENVEYNDKSLSTIYNKDGSLRRTKSELATLRAGAPAGGMIAILELAGSQFKVTTDDVLIVNKLLPVSKYCIGSVHTFSDNVMLVGSSHFTLVGMPYVSGAQVQVMVEEITKDAKVIVFKKRRRKHSQRKKGFRRDVTILRILDIQPPKQYQGLKHEERLMPRL